MRLDGILSPKNVFIFASLLGAGIATPFLIGRGKKHLFDLNKVSGLTTRVGIFWNNSQEDEIIKVAEVNSSSQQSKRKPDLIAEFRLDSLNLPIWWKACLPKTSLLRKNSERNEQTSNLETSSTNKKLCEVQWLYDLRGEEKFQEIKELLKRASQFLEVENSYNFLLPKDEKIKSLKVDEKVKENQGLEIIKKACNISNQDWKDIFSKLMEANPTNCFISPTNMRVDFKLEEDKREVSEKVSSPQSNYKEINMQNIAKSTISGRIDYSLFDYSSGRGKIIKTKDNKNTNKYPTFFFKSQNKYSLTAKDEKNCTLNLEKLYWLVDRGQLTFKDLLVDKSCYKSQKEEKTKTTKKK